MSAEIVRSAHRVRNHVEPYMLDATHGVPYSFSRIVAVMRVMMVMMRRVNEVFFIMIVLNVLICKGNE